MRTFEGEEDTDSACAFVGRIGFRGGLENERGNCKNKQDRQQKKLDPSHETEVIETLRLPGCQLSLVCFVLPV